MAKKDFVVEVTCLIDFDELDPADLNEEGNCAHDGSYLITIDWPEGKSLGDLMGRALDVFHQEREIAQPGDFNIICRSRNKHDQDADFTNLGEFLADPDAENGPSL